MDWLILTAAGLLETFWAVCLKYSDGMRRLWPTVLTLAGMAASFALLAAALRKLPLGTAYAVWTGIGMIGTFIAGIVLFHEHAGAGELICTALILAGIIGLRLISARG